jgi:hypothetical protein
MSILRKAYSFDMAIESISYALDSLGSQLGKSELEWCSYSGSSVVMLQGSAVGSYDERSLSGWRVYIGNSCNT